MQIQSDPNWQNPTDWQKRLGLALALYLFSTLISMAAMSIGAGLLFLAVVLSGQKVLPYFLNTSNKWADRYFWVSLLLTAACLLSLVCARIHPLIYNGKSAEIHFAADMAKCWYLFWPLLILGVMEAIGAWWYRVALRTWIVSFFALSLLGCVQYFIGWPRPQAIPGHADRFHVTLFLGHHLSVASILIFPFFSSLDLLVSQKNILGLSRRFLSFTVLVGALALFGTYSRTLWVALPVGLLLWAILRLPKQWACAAVIATGIAGGLAWQTPSIQHRLLSGEGITTRQLLWKINEKFFMERPWTGTGWHHNLELSAYFMEQNHLTQTDGFVGHAHNNELEMLASTGLVGMLSWVIWCVFGLVLLIKKRKHPLAVGLLCAWVVFQINGLTQVNFWESKVLHQMMWATALALFWTPA